MISSESHKKEGDRKFAIKEFKAAIQDYSQAIKINDNHEIVFKAYANRGLCKQKIGDHKGALLDYDEALKIENDNFNVYTYRGISKNAIKDYKGALEDFNTSIILKKNNSMGDQNGAIQDYSEAKAKRVKKDQKDYVSAYHNRGISRRKVGDMKGAIQDYTETIRLESDHANAYNNRGNIKKDMGDYNSALLDYQAAFKIQPNNPLFPFHLAAVYNKIGNQKEAFKFYQLGSQAFSSQSEKDLKIKFNFTSANIKYFKECLKQYGSLQQKISVIQKAARQKNRPDIESKMVAIKQQVAKEFIEATAEDEGIQKEKLAERISVNSQWMLKFEKELQRIHDELNLVKHENIQLKKKVSGLEESVEKMGKRIYAVDRVLDHIAGLQKNLSEYYIIFYNMIIANFIAYRLTSTGFFKQNVREVTTFDKTIGDICAAQPIIEKIPIIGKLVSIPFQIIKYIKQEKAARLNEVIAEKINRSVFQTEEKISSTLAEAVEYILKNKEFNKKLNKAIALSETKYLKKMMGSITEKIYSKVFKQKSAQFSYSQEVAALHMTQLTIKLYECSAQEFQGSCKSGEKFYDFIICTIDIDSAKDPSNKAKQQKKNQKETKKNPKIEEQIRKKSVMQEMLIDKQSKPKKKSCWKSICCCCL